MVNGSHFSGFIGDIWNNIERELMLQSKIYVATQYGASPDENGNWKGMIGMLHRNEVHVAVTDFFPTPERSPVVDFVSPIARTGCVRRRIFFRKSSG